MLMSSLAMGLVHSEHLNFSTMKSLNFSVLATTSLLIVSKTETVSRGKVLVLIRAWGSTDFAMHPIVPEMLLP